PAVQPTNIVGNLVYLTNPETPGIVSGTYELNNNNLTSTSIILSGTYPIMSATTSYSHFDFSDQIDGFEFTDFYTTINKIFVLNDFPLNLNATEVWSPGCTNNPFQSDNGHVYLTSDVTIPMGKNIEIQDMIFHFPEGIHMYLEAGTSSENGAYLKLNNTVFTSLHNCGETEDFWGGIVLEGNDSPQGDINSSQEPVVYMINSSKIENAVTGILSEVGGIIYANDCDFENNIQAIKFEPFQNTLPSGILKRNISFFNNCDFTVDDNFLGLNLLTPADFTEHVYLEGVDGISFRECRFDNQQSVVYYQSENNIGINTSDAGFTVNCNCDIQLTPGQECPDQYKHSSTFTNLNVGVQVLDGSKAVKISNCEFLDNIVGVGITGLNYPVVTRNDFVIGATDILNNPNLDKQAVAIKTIESTGFQIEENDISLTHNPNPVYFTYGIIIQQSGSDNNEVYNNDFTDIEYGVNALDENRAPVLEFSGLQILCNEFLDLSDKDIAVELYLNFGSGKGIRAFQGNSDNNGISAGNCFTMNIGTPEGNIWNKSERVINYYCPCILNCTGCYFPYEATPYYVNPYLSDISNSCQSHLSQGYDYKMDPGIETATKSNYYVSKTAYYNLLYSYYQQLDGGNTPLVLQQIQSTWPQEAWDLRNDLMAMSPYVSQEALEEAALSCVMPDAMLLEVCLANPDATRSDEFLELLAEGISCPLPQYMVDMVQDNWDAVTSRTILENGLARYGAERDFYANALIRNARFQDEYTLADFKEWHEERASLSDYYAIAGLYIENNYFDTADMVLDDVLIDFELDDNQLIGHNNYVDYYEFMLSLHNYNKTIHDLDSLELISLQAIADEPLGFAKAKAKSILCFAYDVCEPYYGYVSDYQPKSARTNTQDPYKLISDYYNKLKVSPNPVKDHAIFEWELPLLESDARLIISDIMGIVIEEFAITLKQGNLIWDTQKTTNGVYLYEIVENEKQLTNGKLIISK
ncbi:MAG: hypothetical protein U9R19_06160, partial [Bacteroidota bacterium]|nr:hypothetical protein [Bacteroidota bacterium]